MARCRWKLLAQVSLVAGLIVWMSQAYLYLTHFVAANLTPKNFASTDLSVRGGDDTLRDDNSDLTWFLQVSDLHLSDQYDFARATDFRAFCEFVAQRVRPSTVLMTGDITSAKDKSNRLNSRQFVGEWRTYHQILTDTNLLGVTKWLDIRGNHDTFNVESDVAKENMFMNFSAAHKPRSFAETIHAGPRAITFLGVDMTPTPGFKAPYNFLGHMTQAEFEHVQNLATQSSGSDFLLYFGHYPTSLVGSMTKGGISDVRNLLSNGTAYLCGHLHTLFHRAPRLYTRHVNGLLELELGDWKVDRRFRIMAFDQGRFSFQDFNFQAGRRNTFVLVTNPKDVQFSVKGETMEDISRTRNVRLLVFSDGEISRVSVSIDESTNTDMENVQLPTSTGSPLYVTPWDPKLMKRGTHYLTVTVHYADGTETKHPYMFSLDGSHGHFPFFPSFILMMNWVNFAKLTFFAVSWTIILALTVMRLVHKNRLGHQVPRIRISKDANCITHMVLVFLRKIWILSAVGKLFYPLVLYTFYLTLLPWQFAYVLDGRLAIVFSWGIYVFQDAVWSPPNMTFVYGTVTLLIVFAPTILVLAFAADRSFRRSTKPTSVPSEQGKSALMRLLRFCMEHSGIALVLMIQLLHAHKESKTYGLVASLSPYGIGFALLSGFLYYFAITLDRRDLEEVLRIWS